MTVDWTPGPPGEPAHTNTEPSAGPEDVRRAIEQTLKRPSFAIRVGARDWESARVGGDLGLAEALCGALARRGHHTALQVADQDDAGAGRSLDVLVNIRGRRQATLGAGQLNIVWLVSHPQDVADEELSGYDLVLVASAQHTARLRHRLEGTPVAELLQFTDPNRFFPEPDAGRGHELLFVGNWRSTLRPIVWDAVQAGLRPALYGRGWEHVFPDLLVAEHVPQADLRRLYSSCAVLLCDHWDDMRAGGFVSNRVFDALACGALIVSDRCEGLFELFGDAVITYRHANDLGDTVGHFLAHAAERRERAERGRALVLERHTADRRAAEMVEAVGQLHSAPPGFPLD
jgi:glycosyltransferase involved in cell wall biosynthesis